MNREVFAVRRKLCEMFPTPRIEYSMELMELLKLLRAGEGPHVEFKREFPSQAHKLAKAMVAFANTGGGHLLLGVDDAGVPVGIAEPVQVMERLAGVARTLSPSLLPEIDRIYVGERTAIVYAKIQSCPPCLYEGKMFVRVGATSVEATAEDIRLLLSGDWGRRAVVTLPGTLFSPPPVRGFRGRECELARLRSLLLSDGPVAVVVEGIGGVGKTALVARFADSIEARDGRVSFWLDCRADTTFESITAALATFARSRGTLSLCDILQMGERPFEERVASISAAMADQPWALFFDEFHAVADPLANRFLKHVAERSRQVRLFFVCRRRPWLATAISPRLLIEERLHVGLDLDATSQFLSDCGLQCSDDVTRQIWSLTGEGHPKAIEVFVARARHYPLSELLTSLPVFREEFTREWLAPLLHELPEAQRQLALDLSVFDRAIPKGALSSMFPDLPTEGLATGLVDGFILDHAIPESLRMHPLIREFCQALIPNQQSRHQWAAGYYADTVPVTTLPDRFGDNDVEALSAAWWHYGQADDSVGAMSMLDRLRPVLMNRGHYQQLVYLIDHTRATPEKIPWYAIDKARIFALWGQRDEAVAALQRLLLSEFPEVAREALLVLASAYNDSGAPEQAQELLAAHHHWFAANVARTARRRFLQRLIQAHLLLGNASQAMAWASQLVESCEAEGDEIGGAVSLRQMALVLKAQKQLDLAASLGELSRTLLLKHGRVREAAVSQWVLACVYIDRNEPEKAATTLDEALQTFLDMRDHRNVQACRIALEDLKHGRPVSTEAPPLIDA